MGPTAAGFACVRGYLECSRVKDTLRLWERPELVKTRPRDGRIETPPEGHPRGAKGPKGGPGHPLRG